MADQPAEQPLLTLKERAAAAAPVFAIERGYWDTEKGDYKRAAMADDLADHLAEHAFAMNKVEKKAKVIRRENIVGILLDNVADKESWDEQADPELAEAIFDFYDSMCWRMLSTDPTARVQMRLNDERGMVLARTRTGTKPYDAPGVYVTRSKALLLEDGFKPMATRQAKQAERDAAYVEMLMERIPDDAKTFERAMTVGMQAAVGHAKEITSGVLSRLQLGADEAAEADDEVDE